jgi:hypothetical protein
MNDTIKDEFDVIDYEAGASDDLQGMECCSCFRLLRYKFFPKNPAYKSGYDPQCWKCKETSVASMEEHAARLREENMNSEGTRRQRHPDQEEFRKNRVGRPMDCSVFLGKLLHLYPGLYVTQGGIKGDLALYATSGVNKPEWGGQSFKYIGYVTPGTMPEYSSYEFNEERDILLRVKDIGWRSVLLRFVENNILSEAQCNQEFGPPSGGVNSLWYKKLYQRRNSKI